MPQQPAEVSGAEQPSTPIQETPQLSLVTETTNVPLTSAVVPEDPTHPPKKNRILRLLSRKKVLFGLVLLFLVGASLAAGGASDSNGHYAVDGLSRNESGVGSFITARRGNLSK